MTVRLAVPADVPAVGATLGRAFDGEPLFRHVLPDGAERARLAGEYFARFAAAVVAGGEVWVTPELSAAACWRRPGEHAFAPEEAVAHGLDRIPQLIGPDAHRRVATFFQHLGARSAALAPPEHWYLVMLGADPPGHGLGARVVAPVLARADEQRLPCWLETLDPRNVPFYVRHGFVVVEEGVEPSSGVVYRLMLREPR